MCSIILYCIVLYLFKLSTCALGLFEEPGAPHRSQQLVAVSTLIKHRHQDRDEIIRHLDGNKLRSAHSYSIHNTNKDTNEQIKFITSLWISSMKSWHFSKNSGSNTAYVLRSLFLVALVVAVAVVVVAAAAAAPSMGFELLSEARRNLSVKS